MPTARLPNDHPGRTPRPATRSGPPNASTAHRGGAGIHPRSGDVLRITRTASVQFDKPINFRVIRVHDWSTYEGWAWLDGYELNDRGDAVERRSIFVQPAGLLRALDNVSRRA